MDERKHAMSYHESLECLQLFSQYFLGWDYACNKKRISNIEQEMSNDEAIWQREKFYHSTFLVRYSIFLKALGELIVLELSTAKE
jgi:hypothetical protein